MDTIQKTRFYSTYPLTTLAIRYHQDQCWTVLFRLHRERRFPRYPSPVMSVPVLPQARNIEKDHERAIHAQVGAKSRFHRYTSHRIVSLCEHVCDHQSLFSYSNVDPHEIMANHAHSTHACQFLDCSHNMGKTLDSIDASRVSVKYGTF